MSKTNTQIETLLRLVCEGAGSQAKTPSDFQIIAAYVKQRTNENIALNTLKRMWNYGGITSKPRQATLNLMARTVGYRSFEDFCEHYGDCSPSSDIVLGGGVKVQDLVTGQRLMLRWNPNREIVIDYLGNSAFRVIASENSKLQVNDTFQAAVFSTGYPAMLANVIHGDSSWSLYEIGQQGGLTLVRLLPSEK